MLLKSHPRFTRPIILAVVVGLACCVSSITPAAEKPVTEKKVEKKQEATVPRPPKVPGKLKLTMRSRRATKPGGDKFVVVKKEVEWNACETLIVICDMWDDHYCKSAAQRVDAMAPRMNRVVTAARNHGVHIVHAPSGTMDRYKDTPYRVRMKRSPHAKPPVTIARWCYLDPKAEAEMPVDTSKSPCDDPVVGPRVRRYSKQHEAIKIIGYDGVSASGQEIYNYCAAEGIKNVVLMGVHTNMCVLGRPFGIRQMTRLGFNVALARDLTDAMYDPREFPYVSHTRGTELVVEHIEKYWCPSIGSADLTRITAGSADSLRGVKRPVEQKTSAAKR